FQAEDGIRDYKVTGVQTCALPIFGHEEAKRVVRDAYANDPGGLFTVVGYSQGAIVANFVLNDIADDTLGVDKSRFSAKIYADPRSEERRVGKEWRCRCAARQ